ncbi:hypothetical protein Cgig2_001943 [Carnegiea gigantea]|uniref:Uncharacterized protein n=1 Tax=Carnegiea gigantea TaxID=171969 RepID=A0A9Q1K1I4_9CARY|nr:hypothetical protein Cgig2_001943 [Carnegiea gigantea]
MSSNWYNQMRRDSSIFLLESKRNPASKFLQLSIIKDGRRSFIIFPVGWNDRGSARILDALNEIVGPSNLGLGDSHKLSSPQQPLPNGVMPSPSPPPPRPGVGSGRFEPQFEAQKSTGFCGLKAWDGLEPLQGARGCASGFFVEPTLRKVDRERRRDITKSNGRAPRSVNTQFYSRQRSFRNRVRVSGRFSSEGGVLTNWPPDALLVLDTSSPYLDCA